MDLPEKVDADDVKRVFGNAPAVEPYLANTSRQEWLRVQIIRLSPTPWAPSPHGPRVGRLNPESPARSSEALRCHSQCESRVPIAMVDPRCPLQFLL